MVKKIRNTEKALGSVTYSLSDKQKKGKDFSRSIYIIKDINIGNIITSQHIKSIRPGFSMHPKFLNEIIGKKVKRNLKFGDRVSLNDVE